MKVEQVKVLRLKKLLVNSVALIVSEGKVSAFAEPSGHNLVFPVYCYCY